MSKKLKRALSLALLLSLTLSVLSSCGKYSHVSSSEEELRVVGSVGPHDVLFEELRFVTLMYIDVLKNKYGYDAFSGENAELHEDELRKLVYENITSNYAVLSLCSEVGIPRGKPQILEAVDEKLAEAVKEMGGMRKYKKYLEENHLTDNLLRFSIEIQMLENELLYVYRDDLSIIEDDDERIYDLIFEKFICVKHIFVSHSTENAEEKIKAAEEKLKNGSSFSSVISEYSEDSSMTSSGLIIPRGYMNEEYEKVAFLLPKNKISDIVEDSNGYYIIERTEIEPSAVMSQFDYLKELYQTYTLFSFIDERQKELEFIPAQFTQNTVLHEMK